MSEFIYILENDSMPGLLKIGRTERSVAERVNELSSHSGVPTGFGVVREFEVEDSITAERQIHERLSAYRVSDNREFFRIETEDAVDIIDSILEPVQPKRRDFEWEDDLIARAIPIVVRHGVARPRMLEELLGVSYEQALFVIQALRGRGVIGELNRSNWTIDSNSTIGAKNAKADTGESAAVRQTYQLPLLDFLQYPDLNVKPTEWKEELIANAKLMQQTLAQFDIPVEIGDITKGPTITRYEFHAAPGIILTQIPLRSGEISEALEVKQVNILAPIPGKSAVGIDVPNTFRTKVMMRDLLDTADWRAGRGCLPIALGADAYGHPIIADLADMAHLLIAGNTGSGKSLCLNSIIISLLYRFSPNQLRFLLIDPRGFGFQPFNSLPHLVIPVVNEPPHCMLALRWAINEMQKRFLIFEHTGTQNIVSFNARPKRNAVDPLDPDTVLPQKLSYIIVVIDDLGELMRTAKADVEAVLDYLSQNGRAAGIHLILATAQISPEVISERLAASIPSRIAFRCTSRTESRLILGEAGAEKLFGSGDMLFLPANSTKVTRAQGAYISEKEVFSIAGFINAQCKPACEPGSEPQPVRPASTFGNKDYLGEDEAVIQKCIDVIRTEQKASVALLQRRLKLGYGRIARIMDELEARGIIGPFNGAEPREILLSSDSGIQESCSDQPPVIEPCFFAFACKHCTGKIEFDANELGGREDVAFPCPHCGNELSVSASQLNLPHDRG